MAFSIFGQGVVGNLSSDASTRTVNIEKEMKKGDIVIITSMINIGGSYLSRAPDIDGFIKLSPDVPAAHNIHFYFKVIDTPVSNIRFDIKTCYQTTWMIVRGAIVESYNLSASFPLSYKLNSSDKRIAFITGKQPNSDWTPWGNYCYKSPSYSGLYQYSSYYRIFSNDFAIPDHDQYNTNNGQRNYLVLKEAEFIEPRIKHIGTTAPATSYSGVNYVTSWPVPSGMQVGDLIVVMAQSTGSISNSAIISPSGYTKVAEATSNGSMGSSLFYKIATKEDIDSMVSVGTPRSPTGLGYGSINVYRNGKFLSGGVEKTIGFSAPFSGSQEEVVLLQQVRNNYENPRVGFTRIAEHKYGATTMHKYFYNVNNTVPSSIDGDYPEYGVPFTVIGYSEGNEPPTQPGEITGIQDTLYLTSESIQLDWGASTSQIGAPITYDIDIYDGSAWLSVANSVSDISISVIIPRHINTDNAKIRVQAKDTVGNKSPYKESQDFSIYDKMLLIRDRETVKSYKNGIWKTI